MDKNQVKALLPVIDAFANGRPIQYREGRPGSMFSEEWSTINPETTEFRLNDHDMLPPNQWRAKPE